MDPVETSIWMQKVAADPGHSRWYVERFRAMARAGDDLSGEARFVDAMALRDQHMVKLPVIVRNLPDQDSVLSHAIDLRARLEAEALAELARAAAQLKFIQKLRKIKG